MEFTNEIFFNKPLKANNTVIITYFGKLYREHSKDVSIVYGYGDNWDETDSAPMKETENGFEVTIELKNYNTFNFCFNNSFNIWDNNFGFNYIAPILPKDVEDNQNIDDTDDNNEFIDDNNNDNDEFINDGINDDTDETSSLPTEIQDDEQNEVDEQNENSEEKKPEENEENNDTTENFEATFSALLDSILDDTNNNPEPIDISNLSGFGLQAIDEIQEEFNCDKVFEELFEELAFSEESDNTNNVVEAKIEEKQEEQEKINPYDELDSLMNNLLASISEKSETTSNIQEATPIDEIKTETSKPDEKNEEVEELKELENCGLPAVQVEVDEDWIDKIINISFSVTKKITTACKKIGHLIKLKAQELGILDNDK